MSINKSADSGLGINPFNNVDNTASVDKQNVKNPAEPSLDDSVNAVASGIFKETPHSEPSSDLHSKVTASKITAENTAHEEEVSSTTDQENTDQKEDNSNIKDTSGRAAKVSDETFKTMPSANERARIMNPYGPSVKLFPPQHQGPRQIHGYETARVISFLQTTLGNIQNPDQMQLLADIIAKSMVNKRATKESAASTHTPETPATPAAKEEASTSVPTPITSKEEHIKPQEEQSTKIDQPVKQAQTIKQDQPIKNKEDKEEIETPYDDRGFLAEIKESVEELMNPEHESLSGLDEESKKEIHQFLKSISESISIQLNGPIIKKEEKEIKKEGGFTSTVASTKLQQAKTTKSITINQAIEVLKGPSRFTESSLMLIFDRAVDWDKKMIDRFVEQIQEELQITKEDIKKIIKKDLTLQDDKNAEARNISSVKNPESISRFNYFVNKIYE